MCEEIYEVGVELFCLFTPLEGWIGDERFCWLLRERLAESYTGLIAKLFAYTSGPEFEHATDLLAEFWRENQGIEIDWKYLLWVGGASRVWPRGLLEMLFWRAEREEDVFWKIIRGSGQVSDVALSRAIGARGCPTLARFFRDRLLPGVVAAEAQKAGNILLSSKSELPSGDDLIQIFESAMASSQYELARRCCKKLLRSGSSHICDEVHCMVADLSEIDNKFARYVSRARVRSVFILAPSASDADPGLTRKIDFFPQIKSTPMAGTSSNTIHRDGLGDLSGLEINLELAKRDDANAVEVTARHNDTDWRSDFTSAELREQFGFTVKSIAGKMKLLRQFLEQASPLVADDRLNFAHDGKILTLARVNRPPNLERDLARALATIEQLTQRVKQLEAAPRPVVRRVLFERSNFVLKLSVPGNEKELVPGGITEKIALTKGVHKYTVIAPKKLEVVAHSSISSINGENEFRFSDSRLVSLNTILTHERLLVFDSDCEIEFRVFYDSRDNKYKPQHNTAIRILLLAIDC
jgi:hypothetical protein